MPVTNCILGSGVRITHPDLVNLYRCQIGAETTVGPFVEIQGNTTVGERCKISSHSFLCEGVTLEDEVFVGHGVMFTNDRHPTSTNPDGSVKRAGDWTCEKTQVRRGASIGSNATILCGVVIGAGAMVGAGAVVTENVADWTTVVGVPARPIGRSRPIPDDPLQSTIGAGVART